MVVTAGFLQGWLLHHVDSADKDLARQLLANGYSEGGRSDEHSTRSHTGI